MPPKDENGFKIARHLYPEFIRFVKIESQKERNLVARKLRNVFFWCFLLPVLLSIGVLILIGYGLVPSAARPLLGWILLICPITYSLYFLGSEVLRDLPSVYRHGGMGQTLNHAINENQWREKISVKMKQEIHATPEEWKWIWESFNMDLKTLEYRNRFLTALAGAVFFLIMQGIDWLGGDRNEDLVLYQDPVSGWLRATQHDYTQFVGLALFLMLLYLSGSQTSQSLERFLNVVKLIIQDRRDAREGR